MTPLSIFASVQQLAVLILVLAIFAVNLWALIHAATTPQRAFAVEGKRTKSFWVALTAFSALLALLALPPLYLLSFVTDLFMLVIPGIYLTDVRPAVAAWRRRGNSSNNFGQRPPTPW